LLAAADAGNASGALMSKRSDGRGVLARPPKIMTMPASEFSEPAFMKRPSIGSIVWFVAFVGVSILLFRQAWIWTAFGDKQDIIFAAKVFYDSAKTKGDGFVYIGGTLTGEGVANKNNTVMIACHNDRKECLFSSVDQIGPNQVGRLGAPDPYAITTWTPDEIVATGYYASDCRKITINLDRKSESVVWVEEPISQPRAACKNADTKTYKWTIEDPPFWKALRK
jgi:hypothetical protein